MKKIVLSGMLLMGAFSVQAGGLHPTCEQYFEQIDELLRQSPPETEELMVEVKKQLEMGRTQIKQMPMEEQAQGCEQGIKALKQMPK